MVTGDQRVTKYMFHHLRNVPARFARSRPNTFAGREPLGRPKGNQPGKDTDMAPQTRTQRQAAAKKAAATRKRNATKKTVKKSGQEVKASARSTGRSVAGAAKAVRSTAEKAAKSVAKTADAAGGRGTRKKR
jgi:hypothetical protein